MSHRVTIAPADFAALRSHLLQNELEQVAFVFARPDRPSDGLDLVAQSYELMRGEDFAYQSAFHVELSEATQARMIKQAWDRQLALVELHSHPTTTWPVRFSPSDLAGFEEFVPHVWWRLKHQPYAAIVVAPGSLDTLIWARDPMDAEPVEVVQVGEVSYRPTNLTIQSLRRNGSGRAV